MRLSPRKRYFVFEIVSQEEFTFNDVKNALIANCRRCLGEFGCAKANILIIKEAYLKKRGILRTNHTALNDIKAVLQNISQINGKQARFKIIGISGILKKAKNKFLGDKNATNAASNDGL